MRSRAFVILPGSYIFLALGVLLVPLPWLTAWLLAAAVHELFHILALRLFGYPVEQIEIGMSGAKIKTCGLSGLRMSACALAGPLGGFLLLLFLRIAPRIALCGAIQGLYNLLPIRSLDGEKALRGIVEHYLPLRSAERLLNAVENCVLLLVTICCLYATMKLRLGIYPLIAAALLIVRNKKIPCKATAGRVQ